MTMKTSLLPILALASATAAQDLYLTTDSNRLVHIHAGQPGVVISDVAITGLNAGEKLRGIDFRPKNGVLYGLGSTSRVYTIALETGAATPVGPSFVPVLNGTSFGFDFNPTVDKIRVTSDADQNLRLDPDTGGIFVVDSTLGYAAADPYAAVNPMVVASGYTNSLAGATTTTLYGIDSSLDTLVTQAPPNNGTLNTVGKLGLDASSVAGFDIAGTNNLAWAVVTSSGSQMASSALVRINLQTGATTFVGVLGMAEPATGMSILPTPGADLYGFASPGCLGSAAIGVLGAPTLGNMGFAVTSINAIPSSVGRMILGGKSLQTPYTFLDLNLFVDPASPATLWLTVTTDAKGNCIVPLPIPANAGLANLQVFAQFAWLDRCTIVGVSASNAVAVTIK
jgi:hypothetical protein